VPVLVVDIANVMGSRPDGWWRDRAGAAARLMASLVPLVAAEVAVPTTDVPTTDVPTIGVSSTGVPPTGVSSGSPGSVVRIDRIVAVVEGRARTATAPVELDVVLAPADGDTSIVDVAEQVLADGDVPLVVTADRGLRARLPSGSQIAGPGWLLSLL
jgi:hypothetical protein